MTLTLSFEKWNSKILNELVVLLVFETTRKFIAIAFELFALELTEVRNSNISAAQHAGSPIWICRQICSAWLGHLDGPSRRRPRGHRATIVSPFRFAGADRGPADELGR